MTHRFIDQKAPPVAFELGAGTQIDHGAKAEIPQHHQVIAGELVEGIASEGDSPTGHPSIAGRVAAQVPEVERPGQRQHPAGGGDAEIGLLGHCPQDAGRLAGSCYTGTGVPSDVSRSPMG